MSDKTPVFSSGYKTPKKPSEMSVLKSAFSRPFVHYLDVPRYGENDPRFKTQVMHKYVEDGDDEDEGEYSFSIYNPPKPDPELHSGTCKAFNLEPFFDLSDGLDLDAYYLEITGYGGKEGWATLLPAPTEHYMKFPVDFVGDYRCGYQVEAHLFATRRFTTGRFFVSLPEGSESIPLGSKRFDGDDIDVDVVADAARDSGTFWSVLWNPATDRQFVIRIKPGIPEDVVDNGRPFINGHSHSLPGEPESYSYYDFTFLDVMTADCDVAFSHDAKMPGK